MSTSIDNDLKPDNEIKFQHFLSDYQMAAVAMVTVTDQLRINGIIWQICETERMRFNNLPESWRSANWVNLGEKVHIADGRQQQETLQQTRKHTIQSQTGTDTHHTDTADCQQWRHTDRDGPQRDLLTVSTEADHRVTVSTGSTDTEMDHKTAADCQQWRTIGQNGQQRY